MCISPSTTHLETCLWYWSYHKRCLPPAPPPPPEVFSSAPNQRDVQQWVEEVQALLTNILLLPTAPKAKFGSNTLTRTRGNRGRRFSHTVVQNPSLSSLQDTKNDPSCVSSILSFPDFSLKSSKKHSTGEEVSWISLLLHLPLSPSCSYSIETRSPPGLWRSQKQLKSIRKP